MPNGRFVRPRSHTEQKFGEVSSGSASSKITTEVAKLRRDFIDSQCSEDKKPGIRAYKRDDLLNTSSFMLGP